MEKKKSKKPTITIGTDPEFALIDENQKIVRADKYSFFESKSASAQIGSDGAGTPIEIRPLPAKITEVSVMINDITNIFKRIAKWCKKRDFTIHGGAVIYGSNSRNGTMPIGSHIHFGSKEFINPVHYNRDRRRILEISVKDNVEKLAKCLDTYFMPITNFFLPSQEIYDRKKTGYGRLGEWRNQKWGIEYRTPYCFLLSPLLTAGLYSLASLIAYNYKKLNPDKNLYKEAVYYYDLLPSSMSIKVQKNIYKKIKPKLLKIMSYNSPNPKLNSKIISLFNLIEQNKVCKNKDILANYNFDDIKVPPFTIYYSSSNSFRIIRDSIESSIKNKTNGEIYIYRISDFTIPNKRKIILSNGLPMIHYDDHPVEIKYEKKRHGGLKYSIGLSDPIIRDLTRNPSRCIFLVKYLNKLKLRN